jgi:hypothetical protein
MEQLIDELGMFRILPTTANTSQPVSIPASLALHSDTLRPNRDLINRRRLGLGVLALGINPAASGIMYGVPRGNFAVRDLLQLVRLCPIVVECDEFLSELVSLPLR